MFGLHVWPDAPKGVLVTRPGPFMAASRQFEVTITGRGGHAAFPHQVKDPVVAAAHTITALQVRCRRAVSAEAMGCCCCWTCSWGGCCQHPTSCPVQTLASRNTPPVDSAVVSVTRFGGARGAYNIVPSSVSLGGTLRALTPEVAALLKTRLVEVGRRGAPPALGPHRGACRRPAAAQVAESTAAAFGCAAEVDFLEQSEPQFPPTINHPATHAFAERVASQLLGGDGFDGAWEPTMGSEDFGWGAPACS